MKQSTQDYFNKKHLFHTVDNDFPLREDGLIGLPFFCRYDRYAMTPNYLIIDNKKIPLIHREEFQSQHIE